MDSIMNIIRNLGTTRLITIGVITLFMLGFFITILSRVNTPNMALLYGNLETTEAAQIVTRLQALNVPHEIRGESQIWVPANVAPQMRLQMAGEGLVGGSTRGYEIFDKGSSFGTTSLVQDINARRALEGELARTITSMPVIRSAQVHLVMPKRELFSRTQTKPTAAVKVDTSDRVLSAEQVTAIVHLVAAAVPDLSPDSVTLVDQRGQLLSSGKGGQGIAGTLDTNSKYRASIEGALEQQLTGMLSRVVGAGKISVKVNADIDFNRIEENAEIYDPEQQVARSEQRSEERRNAQTNQPMPPVGLTANVPGQNPQGTSIGQSENVTHESETINYEISRTVRRSVQEAGSVRRLSVAALVEGNYTNVDGERQYVPMSDEAREKIATLIRSAIGFNAERGDVVQVVDMPFEGMPADEAYVEPFLNKDQIMRLIEYSLLLTGLLIMVFFVLRPIVKAAQKPRASASAEDGAVAQTGTVSLDEAETMIDLDKVEGRVRESTLRKVGEIIEAHPEESIGVIRSWMAPEA